MIVSSCKCYTLVIATIHYTKFSTRLNANLRCIFLLLIFVNFFCTENLWKQDHQRTGGIRYR